MIDSKLRRWKSSTPQKLKTTAFQKFSSGSPKSSISRSRGVFEVVITTAVFPFRKPLTPSGVNS